MFLKLNVKNQGVDFRSRNYIINEMVFWCNYGIKQVDNLSPHQSNGLVLILGLRQFSF